MGIHSMIQGIALVLAGLTLAGALLPIRVSAAEKDNALEDVRSDRAYTLQSIAGVDALGRTLPMTAGSRQDRYVGLFYFTWLGQQGEPQKEVYDITKLLRTDRAALFDNSPDNAVAPNGYNYFFNEPLYGYYNSADPYVIRKHLELFIAADVDFLAMDFTNAIYYGAVMNVMMDIYLEYQQAGWKVPQIMFFTNNGSAQVVSQAYSALYRSGKYDSLWFRGGGEKPLIIAWEDQLPAKLREYFTVRPPQWPEADFNANGWPYVEKVRPQRVFTNLMSVSVAQHTGDAFSFSLQYIDGGVKESWGRGYSSAHPENGDVEAIQRGDNFQEQWDNAIAADPEIVFVTGWNEWTALKLNADWANNTPFWVDTFNTEFSRDVEMTKAASYVPDGNGGYIEEGYGDNFYMQLVANIRAYKGIDRREAEATSAVSKTVDIYGEDAQWDGVPAYLNLAESKVERASYGYIRNEAYYYTQALPANFIRNIKVTHDSEAIYFRIETEADVDVGEDGATDRLNLLLGVRSADASAATWEQFQYVINRYRDSAGGSASLERFTGGNTYALERIGDVEYVQRGNTLQLRIPRKMVGLESADVAFCFKATDSIEHPEDIMDYYVSGDAVPMGRLVYTYGNYAYASASAGKGMGSGSWKVAALVGGAVLGMAALAGAVAGIVHTRKKGQRK